MTICVAQSVLLVLLQLSILEVHLIKWAYNFKNTQPITTNAGFAFWGEREQLLAITRLKWWSKGELFIDRLPLLKQLEDYEKLS